LVKGKLQSPTASAVIVRRHPLRTEACAATFVESPEELGEDLTGLVRAYLK